MIEVTKGRDRSASDLRNLLVIDEEIYVLAGRNVFSTVKYCRVTSVKYRNIWELVSLYHIHGSVA